MLSFHTGDVENVGRLRWLVYIGWRFFNITFVRHMDYILSQMMQSIVTLSKTSDNTKTSSEERKRNLIQSTAKIVSFLLVRIQCYIQTRVCCGVRWHGGCIYYKGDVQDRTRDQTVICADRLTERVQRQLRNFSCFTRSCVGTDSHIYCYWE